MDGLFAAQGLQVTIVPVKGRPPSTQDLINGQEAGKYDITAGDYVTYIEDRLGVNMPKVNLRIIAEASSLQPNVLTLLVKGGSSISSVSQLKHKTVSVNAPNDIGTRLVDSLLVAHGLKPAQVHYANVPFPGVAAALTTPKSHLSASFVPEPSNPYPEPGKGLPGGTPPGPPYPQSAEKKGAEEHDNADDQQVQQALDDDARDAQRDRHDQQEQEKGNHPILRSVGLLSDGPAAARRRRPAGMSGRSA